MHRAILVIHATCTPGCVGSMSDQVRHNDFPARQIANLKDRLSDANHENLRNLKLKRPSCGARWALKHPQYSPAQSGLGVMQLHYTKSQWIITSPLGPFKPRCRYATPAFRFATGCILSFFFLSSCQKKKRSAQWVVPVPRCSLPQLDRP